MAIQNFSPLQLNSTLSVGVDDTGHDVTFFGATSGKKMLWDQSADTLVVDGTLDINGSADISGNLTGLDNVTSTNFIIGGHTIDDVDVAGEFVDSAAHLLTSAAALDKFHVLNADTTGNADTATLLETERAINGVGFDGSAAITVTAAAGTLSGNTLKSSVVTSSLTSVGTIATGVWNGTVIASAKLDADTAHLTTNQTFTGVKTFDETIVGSVNGSAATVATIAGLAPNTATTQATQAAITTLAGVTSLGVASATTDIAAGDVTMYNAVNDGNPTISLGSSATNRFEIKTAYNSGAQTLDEVYFNTYTTSTSSNDGRYIWQVDEVALAKLLDAGLVVFGNINTNDAASSITCQSTTASSSTAGGTLAVVSNDGAAMGDDHRLGVIEFKGAEDASNTLVTGASIQAMCDRAWSASENGTRLEFYTMDGNASSELSLTLDSDKLATFAGGVTVTGTITGDVTGDLTGEADTVATIAGLAPNTATTQATQGNITTCSSLVSIGTISTGVWEGTAIASDQQKHVMHYQTTGFSIADGTNYEAQENMSTNAAPFQHNTSTGADGLTAQTPQVWMRMGGGHVMPRACTLKRWTGWAASAGSGTTYLGLFKVTMTRNSSTTVSAVLLEEFSYTALGNNKNEDFDETSFTATAIAAGDIVFTAMKGVNNKAAYFNGTFEVEF